MTITKLDENIFRFEYEDSREAKTIQALDRFEYESVIYRVKHYHMAVEIPGYFSYIVITK